MILADDVEGGARDYGDRLRKALDTISIVALEAVVARLYSACVQGRTVFIGNRLNVVRAVPR